MDPLLVGFPSIPLSALLLQQHASEEPFPQKDPLKALKKSPKAAGIIVIGVTRYHDYGVPVGKKKNL